MKLQNCNILIVSNEKWGDIWYSKHNWANELSVNNNVYFINPPLKWNFSNLFSSKIKINQYTENLKILNYVNRLPFTRFELIYKMNEVITSFILKKWFKKNNIINYIFWTFDPYRFSNPKKLNPFVSIYFIADKYQIKREKYLIDNTEFIISVSSELVNKEGISNPLILSHGISSSEFNADSEVEIKPGYILYVGNIDYRLDYLFIKKILTNFPTERLLFIGKINKETDDEIFKEIFITKKYSNLIYHPPIHFKNLKNYIAKAKICIAPMKLNVNGNNINHHKLLQYLAQGKPVVSAQFKDYENSDILFSYQNHWEGITKIQSLIDLEEYDCVIKGRINFAKKHLYENLIVEIEKHLSIKKS